MIMRYAHLPLDHLSEAVKSATMPSVDALWTLHRKHNQKAGKAYVSV